MTLLINEERTHYKTFWYERHLNLPPQSYLYEKILNKNRARVHKTISYIFCDLLTNTNSFDLDNNNILRERCIEKKVKKKPTSVSFMHVCVAENVALLVFFFTFFCTFPIGNFLS